MVKKKQEEKGITVKKEKNPSEWYSQVCLKSGLADYGPVKGTLIIRPLGYSIWQKIQNYFNKIIKKRNVKNAYFPLFIPESFFKKEAEHAKGFTPEVAWIKKKEGGEKIALRPTSETVMYNSYSKWIRSWRDLPLKINQWGNIVRWEVSDTKLFIRSREFLWQEGHCAYSKKKQAEKETWEILDEYEKLCRELLAIPLLKGKKTKKETFAGADYTTTIEAFTPEGKALQCGTSHFLGQNFSKAFDIKFEDEDGKEKNVFQNSWGFSTRLIGALVMAHSDNKGLVLPPKIAPTQVIIIPIFKEKNKKIIKQAEKVKNKLKKFSVKIDKRQYITPGYKFNEYELKGVPLRIEIGPKDIKKNQVILVRRDTGKKENVKIKNINKKVKSTLEKIQKDLYKNAESFLKKNIEKAKRWKEFEKIINNKKMALAPFCGKEKCEDLIKDKTNGASSRVIKEEVKGKKCIQCGKKAKFWVYFSKAY